MEMDLLMLRLRKDYPKVPMGGWHYADLSGVTIYGKDADDLIKNIAEFRLQNSLPPGSPEYELTFFMAERYPDFVERTEYETEIPLKTRSDYLADWTNSLWRDPPKKLIPVKLAAKRIETCEGCPFRREWNPKMEDSNELAIVKKLVIISQGNYRRTLGYCAAHHAHAGLLVLVKEPQVKTLPACCWIGKEDNLTDDV